MKVMAKRTGDYATSLTDILMICFITEFSCGGYFKSCNDLLHGNCAAL